MYREKCLFCFIANGNPENTIFYKDKDVVIFEDKRPAAEYHYLAVPRSHIGTVNDLKPKHIGLLENMKKAAEYILNRHIIAKAECVTGLLPSSSGPTTVSVPITPIPAIFGFHVPPYNSQNHLHMHIVAPADKLSHRSRERILGTGCFRFRSYEAQLRMLNKEYYTHPAIREHTYHRTDGQPNSKRVRLSLVKPFPP